MSAVHLITFLVAPPPTNLQNVIPASSLIAPQLSLLTAAPTFLLSSLHGDLLCLSLLPCLRYMHPLGCCGCAVSSLPPVYSTCSHCNIP